MDKITRREELECARHVLNQLKEIFKKDSPESVLSDSELDSYYKALEVVNNARKSKKIEKVK